MNEDQNTIYNSAFNRAKKHWLYVGNDETSTKLEASLILCSLLEEMLIKLGKTLLKNFDKILSKNRRNLNFYIETLYFTEKISRKEFKGFNRFKKDRNKLIHQVFSNTNDQQIEKQSHVFFKNHEHLFKEILLNLEQQ